MAIFKSNQIRNVALIGHGGDGKTALAEAMLYISKATDRLGKSADGNTVCDFDPEEIKRSISISASLAHFEWKNTKINILDTPGYFDFEGEVRQAIRVADTALIVVDGKSGHKVGTELTWDLAQGKSRAFFVNKLDDENSNFRKTLKGLEETLYVFGDKGTVKAGGMSVNRMEVWNVPGEEDRLEEIRRECDENPENVYGFGHTPLYRNVIEAIEQDGQPLVDAEAGMRALELILAMYQSAMERRPVKLPLENGSTLDYVGRFDQKA